MKAFLATALILSGSFAPLNTPSAYADDAKALPDLTTVCKSDCPKAKTSEEAHKCAEKLGRLNKAFQKTKCYIENEKYEEMTKGAAKKDDE